MKFFLGNGVDMIKFCDSKTIPTPKTKTKALCLSITEERERERDRERERCVCGGGQEGTRELPSNT